MKRIEDIEKMGLEELEAAAMEEKVEVPQGLAGRIQERILAAELAKEPPIEKPQIQRKRILQYSGIAAAAVVVLALVLLKPRMEKDTLQDTRDLPALSRRQKAAYGRLCRGTRGADVLHHAACRSRLCRCNRFNGKLRCGILKE